MRREGTKRERRFVNLHITRRKDFTRVKSEKNEGLPFRIGAKEERTNGSRCELASEVVVHSVDLAAEGRKRTKKVFRTLPTQARDDSVRPRDNVPDEAGVKNCFREVSRRNTRLEEEAASSLKERTVGSFSLGVMLRGSWRSELTLDAVEAAVVDQGSRDEFSIGPDEKKRKVETRSPEAMVSNNMLCSFISGSHKDDFFKVRKVVHKTQVVAKGAEN